MNEQFYVENHVLLNEFGDNTVQIRCGHQRIEYTINLRQDDPAVTYMCCFGCYHMILGDMIERAFTIKTK